MEEKQETTSSLELGTLGELLLACAVNRHGTNSWESIAEELRKRLNHHFSPHFCQQKYLLLKRRFNNLQLLSLTDELRKLRVQDLKQQLHRHNTSIATLQLKVQRLKEELSDKEETDPKNEATKVFDLVENRSYNESNESNQNNKGGGGGGGREPEEKGEITSEEDRTGLRREKMNTNREGSSRMKRRRVCRGDESLILEGGANKRIDVKSQPLIKLLETLRSHKHGSPFITRLPSQETEKYQRLVRQHMDLDTVEYRFHKGNYNDCHSKFYRDLLLIFTNAVIFYRKSSAEHMAARELRKLVLDEIALRTCKPNDDETQPIKPNPDIQHLDPVVKKPRSSSTFSMAACRRRTSISTQALSDSMKSNEKDDSTRANSNSNGVVTRSKEKDDNHKFVAEERCLLKQGGLKVMSDNVSVYGRGRTKNVKGEPKYSVSEDDKKKDEGRSESEGDEPLELTRKKGSVDQKKGMTTRFNKQGVANFLKRINQNSPSSQEKKAKVIKKDVDDEDDEDKEEEGERERRTKMRNDRNNNDHNSKGKKMKSGNAKRSNSNGDETKEEKATGRNLTNKRLSSTSSPDSVKGGRRCLRSNGGETSRRRARSRR